MHGDAIVSQTRCPLDCIIEARLHMHHRTQYETRKTDKHTV